MICRIAFDQPPLTRRERASNANKRTVLSKYGPQAGFEESVHELPDALCEGAA